MGAHHAEDRTLFGPGSFPTFYDDPDYRLRACRDMDVDVFFPERGAARGSPVAKQACNRCPIKVRCREWALSRPWNDVYGVWGGLSQLERREEQMKGRQECPRCKRWIAVRDGRLVLHHSAPKWICR